ncbi:hypothetical protein LHJ74_20390 [Streptomyces sp. N2-109]|uniref:Uncharacterized protein n=1 Tax=Streptomyces gossypii TaxID=2883101 RepID=A0ABT2JWF6_9ACTN|nr:hypothetical protein [Streptomyces gossypii]MCT2592232.1 hypothetical protein [Streptomyces gossypii]
MPKQRDPSRPFSRAHRGQGRTGSLVMLPAAGCTLPVPPLPTGRQWTDADRERWAELWQSPQATQWDDTVRGTVAVLLVYEAAILAGEASAWQAQEARHAGEALGLTPRAMIALGWRIIDGGTEEGQG